MGTGDNIKILSISYKTPNTDRIDIYSSLDVETEFVLKQEELDEQLQKYAIERITVTFDEPLVLSDCYAIRNKVDSEIKKTYSEKYSEYACRELDFLLNQLDGMNWKNEIAPCQDAYDVHSAEIWLMSTDKDIVPILAGLYGLTEPGKTNIKSGKEMIEKYGERDISAAFTFQEGFYVPLGMLQRSLGRNPGPDVDSDKFGEWVTKIKSKPASIFYEKRFRHIDLYKSSPFTTPVDAILYPRDPKEFGARSDIDINYLEGSLRAKKLIHAYLERIMNKKLPVWESEVKNRLDL